MKYPAYPKYKDSGVEWLGEVPEHWEVKRLKHYIQHLNSGASVNSDNMPTEDGFPGILKTSCVYGDVFRPEENKRVVEEEVSRVFCPLVGDSLVISRMNTPELVGSCGYVAQDWTNLYLPDRLWITVFTDKRMASPKFFWYRIISCDIKEQISSLATGTSGSMKNLMQESFLGIAVAIPPLLEQRTIAAFLDAQTSKLDTLITKKRELIDKLKEKRAALITRTVTRGLPPDAATAACLDPHPKMKDSGVEWLGEVPEHWKVKRLKHIAKLQTGITLGKDRHNKHTVSVPYLRVANVQDGYIDISDVSEIEIEAHEIQNYALRKGDVLMNEGGDNDKLGRGAVWSGDISPCIHQNHVFCFRPFGVIPEFLSLYMQSLCAKYYLFLSSRQSTNLASISSRNIIEIHIPVPPRPEQELILGYLVDQFVQIDTTTRLAEETIEKLLEYRAALITAAVTGQIDVREAVQ